MKEGIIDNEGNLLADSNSSSSRDVVLGRDILEEVWADRDRIELPRHITPGPKRLGTLRQHLTADKCRSVATIHLVITLIRCWGGDSGRRKQMLVNYMHFITALEYANLRKTREEYIDLFTFHFKQYLEGFVQLYKEASIVPSHHLCLHLEFFLRQYGPVHSWRAWVFERFNFLLKNIKTNNRFGTLLFVRASDFFLTYH